MNLSLKWYNAFNNVSESQITYMRLLLLNNEDQQRKQKLKYLRYMELKVVKQQTLFYF